MIRQPYYKIGEDEYHSDRFCPLCRQNPVHEQCSIHCLTCHLQILFCIIGDGAEPLESPSASRSSAIAAYEKSSLSPYHSSPLKSSPERMSYSSPKSLTIIKTIQFSDAKAGGTTLSYFTCKYPGCCMDFIDCCSECSTSEDACYCEAHLNHFLYHSKSYSSSDVVWLVVANNLY